MIESLMNSNLIWYAVLIVAFAVAACAMIFLKR